MLLKKSLTYQKGITLIELLIAITLLGIIAAAGTAIDFTSRMALIRGTKRVDVRGRASFAMEHMVRHIRLANRVSPATGTVTGIKLRRDYDSSGSPLNTPEDFIDYWVEYQYSPPTTTANTIQYRYSTVKSLDPPGSWSSWETIAKGVLNPSVAPSYNLFDIKDGATDVPSVTITIMLRKFPGQPESVNNPEVTLKSRANLWCRGRI